MRMVECSIADALNFYNGKAVSLDETGEIEVFGSNGKIGFSKESNHENAIILGRVGAYCGSVMLSPEKFWATDNTIVLKTKGEQSLRYWFYLLGHFPIRSFAGGAAQPLMTHGILRGINIKVHADTVVQGQIANILSTYDDLIENNRRRMALLEESARLLYREWFVRLRFPGYEHTPIVDGVPQGWERTPLEEALVLQRGFDLPTQDRQEGNVPIYGSTGILGHHDKAKAAAPGVVTGRSGTLGEVQYVAEDYWPLNTALWVKEFKCVTPLFTLFLLREMDLKQFNGGASVPTLDRKSVHRVEVLIPSAPMLLSFNDFAADVYEQIQNLSAQNQKLRTARDLLLPRLIGGELAV